MSNWFNTKSKIKIPPCIETLYDNILSFITTFNYLLIADSSPLATVRKTEHLPYSINKKGKIMEEKEDWIIKHIYIDKRKIKDEKNSDSNELDKTKYITKEAIVRAHWRLQAYGTGLKDRRWKHIESYPTTRLVREGDTKNIVSIQK